MLGFSSLGQAALGEVPGTGAHALFATTGTFTLSGKAAALKAAKGISAARGIFTLTGNASTGRGGFGVFCAHGTFTITGIAVVAARKLAGKQFIRMQEFVLSKVRTAAPTLDE